MPMISRLHSKLTFVQRRLFPWVFTGMVLAAMMPTLNGAPVKVIVMGGLVAGSVLLLGGLGYRALLWPLMDEALLTGAALWVRRGRVEVEIPLASVQKVTSQLGCSPQSITLHLEAETALGRRISFMAPRGTPWGLEHPLVTDLRRRINEAQAGRSAARTDYGPGA